MAANLQGLMNSSMEKIKELIDVNTIVGQAITSPDGTIIIPVSRVSFGFVSGGTDLPKSAESFAGGSSAGITIKPSSFIVLKPDGDVRLLEVGSKENAIIDGAAAAIPEIIAKVKGIFSKDEDDE